VPYANTIPSWPSSRLIEELRSVPHTSRYEGHHHGRAARLVFLGNDRHQPPVLGVIDYTYSPARAYRVDENGNHQEIV
jgi:hypothetical protein